MDNLELQKLRDLPIEGVAERLGLRVSMHKALCPFHDDHHASLSFSRSRNTYRCFVCGEHGGTIDLAMKLLPASCSGSNSFVSACRWLADSSNIILTEHKASPPPGEDGRGLFDANRYSRLFEHPWLSDAANAFLFDERHLDARVIRWCRLTSWRDRNGTNWLQIPYFNKDGKLIGIQNRNLDYSPSKSPEGDLQATSNEPPSSTAHPTSPQTSNTNHSLPWEGWGGAVGAVVIANHSLPSGGGLGRGDSPTRFRFPQGSRCSIYNLPVLNLLKPGEPLYIAEGCSDCWSLLSAGHKAIAIPSATLLKPDDMRLLTSLTTDLKTEFHMYPDRDVPGERLFLQLKQFLPNLVHHNLPPDCKDFSDYYSSHLIPNLLPPHS